MKNLKLICSFALKQILHQKKYHLFFLLNLSLGLWGLLSLNIFSQTLDRELTNRSKTLLGADITIGARRLFQKEELRNIENQIEFLEKTKTIRLFTMIQSGEVGKLVRLKGIENNYPLIGSLEFKEELDPTEKNLKERDIWVYPEILYQLNIKLGDTLNLGSDEKFNTFKITKVILRDSSDASNGFSLAPRAYMHLNSLKKTGLVSPLSTLREKHYYKVTEDTDLPIEIKNKILKTERSLSDFIKDETISITTPEEASEDIRRSLERLNDFLGLVTIVSLFLSMIGINYLFKSHVHLKRKDFALYHVLGISKNQGISIFFMEILILSLLATFLAIGMSYFSVPLINELVQKNTDLLIKVKVSFKDFVLPFFIGLFGSILSCFPNLLEMRKIQLVELFGNSPKQINSLKYIFGFIPLIIYFFLLSVYQSRSLLIGTAFMLALIGALFLCVLLAKLIFTFIGKRKFNFSPSSFALRNIGRNQVGSLSIFIAIALGSLLINIIPQVKNSIEQELNGPEGSKLPSLFLFDIQSFQIDSLKRTLEPFNQEVMNLSPLVRSRLIKKNGELFEKSQSDQSFSTQESEQRERFRNRGINLTFPYERIPSHDIVKGKPFSGEYDWNSNKPIEVSIETRYAKRLDLDIGDKLLFDIQGIEMEAIVINTRRIDWLTFRPNFFVEMQPGSIDDAPKSFIGVVYENSMEMIQKIQFRLAKVLPSISVVDLNQVIKEILKLVDNLQIILRSLALFSFIIGIFILYTVSNYEAQKYSKETNLLKVLGAPFKFVQRTLLLQFVYISLFASLVGIILSILIALGISFFIFQNSYVLKIDNFILSTILINIFALITCFLSTRKVLKSSPASLF